MASFTVECAAVSHLRLYKSTSAFAYQMPAKRFRKKESPYEQDELHRQPICRIMQGDSNIKPTTMLQWTVSALKTSLDNLDIINEAINSEKQTIAGTLYNVKHAIKDRTGVSCIDEYTGMCILDREMVKCMPLLQSGFILETYFKNIESLNDKFSNSELPCIFNQLQNIVKSISNDKDQHFISSMGMVPNKRMTDQGNFNRNCEFGSLSHVVHSTHDPKRCILGHLISREDIATVMNRYAPHKFYQHFINEALINLKIQADYDNDKRNMDVMVGRVIPYAPDHMQHPVIDDMQTHAPVILHTAHAMVTVYRSSNRIIHESDDGVDYSCPAMQAVFRTMADISTTTVTCTPYKHNQSNGYLKRAFNNDQREYILAQIVNYKCTYLDRQKAHLPDVEFKVVTVNHGPDPPEDLSAIVHELGNGTAMQFDIFRRSDSLHIPSVTHPAAVRRNLASFFGFGTQIASEVIHQSTINALHDIVKRKDSANTNQFPQLFSKWNVKEELQTLLFNVKKNIIPYNKKTDDPEMIFGQRLDISFSMREFGLIVMGKHEREIGRLHRADLVALVCPVARSFKRYLDLHLWVPEWDLPLPTPLMSPISGVRRGQLTDTRLGSVYSDSSCGMTMEEIMHMASRPSDFDDEL